MAFFDEPFDIVPSEGRVEGIAKVTGKAKYAAEYNIEGLCYAVLVDSTIASGTIKSIHTEKS